MDADERARLRAKAEKATPGPWWAKDHAVCIGGRWTGLFKHPDAAYIAALSPDVVRHLLDDVERLEKGRDGALAISAETNVKLGDTLSKAWEDVQTERKRAVGWYEEAQRYCQNADYWRARAERLEAALRKAEAALADIGDSDHEPTDDLAWCERRAMDVLPMVRAALAEPAPGGQDAERAADKGA